ncbi:hypothetical protein FSP39_003006 [Pinctada imbricata]|uniref:Uncharacterized protein n=1 Tax=Pinctada imbricata TaxID=66713 RepID=A0AA89CCG8_PINIB|nr:hypothetical protein FSP39_003006 [Pinctada imbricata]
MSDTKECEKRTAEGNEQTIENKLNDDFKEALDRLDDVKFEADADISEIHNGEIVEDESPETQSLGAESSTSGKSETTRSEADADERSEDKKSDVQSGKDAKSPPKEGKKGGKSVFSRLKRLTKFDKSREREEAQQQQQQQSKFSVIRIDKLPQVFVVKYLGKRDAKGLFGLHHVRKPVDEMVGDIKEKIRSYEKAEFPLVYMVFSGKGIDIREHKSNTVKEGVEFGLVPIDFISYGVQDIKYWRVFTFIVVRQISSRTKETECHAVLADSTINCRRMALSLGASFNVYKRKLATEGKVHNFQVELRPPDELAEQYGGDVEA